MIQKEQKRVENYLDSSSEGKLMATVNEKLIKDTAKTLIESGCEAMFTENRQQNLLQMYELFSRVPETLSEISEFMCK